jgi:hypothetical protein
VLTFAAIVVLVLERVKKEDRLFVEVIAFEE